MEEKNCIYTYDEIKHFYNENVKKSLQKILKNLTEI